MGDKFAVLASLLKERAGPTNHLRQRQIETQLNNFRQSDESWDDARIILAQSNDPHMQFFAFSVYEDWIATRWRFVADDRKADLAAHLLNMAVTTGKSLSHPVYTYLLKVISHIGRVDWPERAPEFMDRVLELASTAETSMLGVYLLQMISEEWTSSKSRIESSRRIALRHMLTEVVPQIVTIFAQILGALWSDNVQEVTTNGNFGGLDANASYISNFANNGEAAELVKTVLSALQSYVKWAPLNLALQPTHVEILFKYILLNDMNSIHALDNINEMLERNCLPAETGVLLGQLHNASLTVLSKMVKDPSVLGAIDQEYLTKWTQFINLFVQYHLRRDESLNFSDFLLLFAKYSFAQPTSEGFLDCLDIWEIIFTLLQNHVEANVSIAPFTDVVCEFCSSVMRSLFFRYNAEHLEKLDAATTTDDTALTEDEESSELDAHIDSALSVISLAYSLYTEPLQRALVDKLLEPVPDFLTLHTVLSVNLSEEQARNVYYVIRDANTAVRGIALIGSQFIANFAATFADAVNLLRALVELSEYIKQHDLQKYSPEAARLSAELFGAMRGFSEWCGAYWAELQASQGDPSDFDQIISAMLNCDGLALNSRSLGTSEQEPANIPELVPLSAAVHLRNLAENVHSPRIANLAVFAQFVQDAHAIAACHTVHVQSALYSGISFIYLVPWHSTQANQQQWDARAASFAAFIEGLTQPFEQAALAVINRETLSYSPQIKELIDKTLVVLTGMLRESSGKLDKSGLTIVWNTLQNSIKASVELLGYYLDDLPILFRLLQLHIQVFSVLAPQVPHELASTMVTALITHLSAQNRLEQLLQDVGGYGHAVGQRLLCLLKALISRQQAPFLADVFNFCVDLIYPSILNEATSIDVEQSFYEVWCEILLNHYKFLTQSPEVYRVGLNCFLRAFQGQDLDIFRLVIHTLLDAQRKRTIFAQQLFWSEGYAPMLSTLFHVMIQRMHESMHEQILELVFQIIQGGGFDPFFDEFIPSFLIDTMFHEIPNDQKEALRQKLGRPTDPPTLSRNIENLLSDLSFMAGVLRQ